jgi:hypothetical protein
MADSHCMLDLRAAEVSVKGRDNGAARQPQNHPELGRAQTGQRARAWSSQEGDQRTAKYLREDRLNERKRAANVADKWR